MKRPTNASDINTDRKTKKPKEFNANNSALPANFFSDTTRTKEKPVTVKPTVNAHPTTSSNGQVSISAEPQLNDLDKTLNYLSNELERDEMVRVDVIADAEDEAWRDAEQEEFLVEQEQRDKLASLKLLRLRRMESNVKRPVENADMHKYLNEGPQEAPVSDTSDDEDDWRAVTLMKRI